MELKKLIFAIVLTLAMACLVSTATAQKNTLVVATGFADANRLDPHLTSAGQDKTVLSWMFNGLTRIQPGEASPEFIGPDLAESWTSNPGGTEWTFKLREKVRFHHGYGELTSEDIVYSLNRAANPKTSSFSADFAAFDQVEAIDKYTVKIRLKYPIPSLLGLLSGYHGGNIVCQKAAVEMGEDFKKKPIGAGPFMFAEYKSQQLVRLIAHKQYFRGAPKLEEIIYRYISSDASRDLAFQSGEADMIFGKQEESWVQRIMRIPGAKIAVLEPAELNTLHLNMSMKPLDDIRVREAIAHAIDRQALVKFRGDTANRPAKSVVPIGYLGYNEMKLPSYDPAKSRKLLAEAGHPNGVTVKAIQSTMPALMTILEPVQEQLRKVGINLVIEPVEHATFHSQIRQNLSQVVLYQAARFPVADTYLTQFYLSDSIVGTPKAVTNFSHCKAADDEIKKARIEQDPEKQKALWKAAQRKILDDMCSVPLYESLVLWAYKDSLDLGYNLHGSLNLGPPITEATRFKK
ncbi:MAG: ABC transporter substrate-binding protein [Thermodesulfobacteriota bacterium]